MAQTGLKRPTPQSPLDCELTRVRSHSALPGYRPVSGSPGTTLATSGMEMQRVAYPFPVINGKKPAAFAIRVLACHRTCDSCLVNALAKQNSKL